MTCRGGILLAALAAVVACGRTEPSQEAIVAVEPKLDAALARVREARILFSHHSVGRDILAGVERLSAEAAVPLRIAPVQEAAGVQGGVLAHASGGNNGDPASKLLFFAETVRAQPRPGPDLAFMKFCYVDFHPRTDVQALLREYRSTIEAIRRERPDIRLAHVTAPLVARPTDVKSRARRLLGKEVWEDAANARRAEFNEGLRQAFPADPIFDLARAEATAPDGRATGFSLGGRDVSSMYPGYTHDGGHLSPLGQRVVGAAAVRFLAGALPPRAP